DLPLAVTIVHVLQSEPLPRLLEPVFGVADANCAGRQEVDGRLRVTSGALSLQNPAASPSGATLAPSADDLACFREIVAHLLPAVSGAPVHRTWSGLLDQTPDALPVLDAPQEVSGLVVGAGFSGHGFCLGPVSGESLADLALGRPARHDLTPFRLSRFANP